MDQPARRLSTFVCHPDFITPSIESPPNYPINIASRDLLSLSRALKNKLVFRGDLSKYTEMFEETDVFIRFVHERPLRVRTFIPQRKLHSPYFFEYPAQVPHLSFFTHKAILLEKRKLICTKCASRFTGYYYHRQHTTHDSAPRSRIKQLDGDWREKKEKSKETSAVEGEHGMREKTRKMMQKAVKRATKYIYQGARWIKLQLTLPHRRLKVNKENSP